MPTMPGAPSRPAPTGSSSPPTAGGRSTAGAGRWTACPAWSTRSSGAVPVLMDSGVRGGADVLKALALGATAVCLGRPYALALGLAGAAGVSELLANVIAEFDLTLGLCGYASVAEVGPEAVRRR